MLKQKPQIVVKPSHIRRVGFGTGRKKQGPAGIILSGQRCVYRCLGSLRHGYGKQCSAFHRRKLIVLIYHLGDCGRESAASHPIDYHICHQHLSLMVAAAGFRLHDMKQYVIVLF